MRLAEEARLDEATALLCALASHPRETAAALVAANAVTPLVTQLREGGGGSTRGSTTQTPRTSAALVQRAAAALGALTSLDADAGGAAAAAAAAVWCWVSK